MKSKNRLSNIICRPPMAVEAMEAEAVAVEAEELLALEVLGSL